MFCPSWVERVIVPFGAQHPGLVAGFPNREAKVSANLSDSLSPNGPYATVTVFDNRELLSWSPNVNKKARKAFEILARENSRMLTVYLRSLVRDGTPGRNGPLQGGKGGLWNGGIRIPLFIRGPMTKAGSHSSVLVTGADLVPTVADLAGVSDKLSEKVEGGSLRQLLVDPVSGEVARPRDELTFHFPHYDKDPLGPVSAIIADDFKLLRIYDGERHQLFDLAKDIGERNDLSGSRQDKVQQLSAQLSSYLDSIDAGMPVKRSGDTPASAARRNTNSRPDAIMQGLDKNNDGQLTKDELERLPALLRSLDKNKDGNLSRDETRGR